MAKFYVESGPAFKYVVQAAGGVEALLKAFKLTDDSRPLQMADVVIVNERGFVWDRRDHQLHGDEQVWPTALLLDAPVGE